MDWIVQNARNTDVERQHLNKILADIRASIIKVEEQARLIINTDIHDVVGGMLVGEQTGIKVWYDATKSTINFRVPNFTIRLTGDVEGSGTVDQLTDVNIVTTLNSDIVGITEAPVDGQAYWRRTAEWEAVPLMLESLATLPDNGFIVFTDDNEAVARTILGTTDRILVTDGDGADNPVIDFIDEGIQDLMAATLVAGENITINYDDVAGEITIASTSSGGVLPVVTGEVPPVLVYFDDGSLMYSEID